MMETKGPMPGWSAKADVLSLCPSACCVRRESGSIRGYVVFRAPGGVALASAGSASGAWRKALAKLED